MNKNKRTIISRRMLVKDLTASLRDQIQDGNMAAGEPVLSAGLIAKKYNVSVLTANRALDRLELDGLVDRVQGSGTFVADNTRRDKALKIGLGFFVSFDVIKSEHESFGAWRDAARAGLRENGHMAVDVFFQDIHESGTEKVFGGLDGLIISSGFIDQNTLQLLLKWNKPIVVIVLEHVADFPFHQVIPDMQAGFESALRHLLEKGHEKIALASTDGDHSLRRREAFYAAAGKLSIAREGVREIVVPRELGDQWGRDAGREIGRRILALPCSAVVSTSDFLSFGIVDAFLKAGLKVGKDKALASYDDLEGDGILPFGKPFLTAIRNPRAAVARCAAQLMLERISRRDACTHIIRVPTRLIIRSSSDPE